jgi:diguanylate cyclase (GGDEF)-like protein
MSEVGRSRTPRLPADLAGAVARALSVPVALLSRGTSGWRFEADAFPDADAVGRSASRGDARTDQPWTAIEIGEASNREWVLVVPGSAAQWSDASGLEALIASVRDDLARRLDGESPQGSAFARRLYAFARRLSRAGDASRTHQIILSVMAQQVRARTASIAVYSESERLLTISATRGYPHVLVEHVRIRPGAGVLGHAFATGKAVIGRASEHVHPRRLRYAGDTYLVVPLLADKGPVACVALTDRVSGEFDERDLECARMLGATAGLALARERVTESLDELTRVATVDPVTGLFNRRYFETRLHAEVQRARRQSQDLALLMVDIDDFKRINDTFGHLEGDRALKEVADLLRSGVRIFDLCARYGGEEFAIVMPGATRQMATQVAERIRRGIQERSRLDPLPVTVSIGVGLLKPDHAPEDLIGVADRALIAAKRAGKNAVLSDEG